MDETDERESERERNKERGRKTEGEGQKIKKDGERGREIDR